MSEEIIEEWKLIPEYENYKISNLGRIKSLNFNRSGKEQIMKQTLTKNGYYQIGLRKNGIKKKWFSIHQLVAQAFLNHIIAGHSLVINHINGIKTDNSVENLEIVTQRENCSTCTRSDRDTMSSQLPGASWHKKYKKWKSQYYYQGKVYHLGLFNTDIEAHNKWKKAYEADKNGTFEIFILQFKHCNMSGINQYSKNGEFIRSWNKIIDIERELSIFGTSIAACCRGRIKSAGDYVWKYKEKEED